MECLAELYIANRQPGQALQYFLRLRRPNVFQLIQDNNLYTDVQGQVLLLVEFDQELIETRRKLENRWVNLVRTKWTVGRLSTCWSITRKVYQ
jgi:hypothetical protein